MRRGFFILAILAACLQPRESYARVDADPNKDYAVSPDAGPWMICTACYTGADAPRLARELVLEIRSRYDLPAWVMNRGEDERRRQREELKKRYEESLKALKEQYPDAHVPFRTTRVEEQCAVLIGGYKDMDTAHRALKDIKKLQPPSSEKFMLPWAEVFLDKKQVKEGYMNPFLNSFVVRNPTVPVERPAANKSDPFIKKLNAHETYSVLHCKKPWTLVVATFQGLQVIQPKSADKTGFLENVMSGFTGEKLEASGHNARNLVETLRGLGYKDAYVLHTRWGSVVTIGEYDRYDDPAMSRTQRTLESQQLIQKLNLLAQPMPMEVPRF